MELRAGGRGRVGARRHRRWAANTLFQLGPCVACASCSYSRPRELSTEEPFTLTASAAGGRGGVVRRSSCATRPPRPALTPRRAGSCSGSSCPAAGPGRAGAGLAAVHGGAADSVAPPLRCSAKIFLLVTKKTCPSY